MKRRSHLPRRDVLVVTAMALCLVTVVEVVELLAR